MNRVIYLLFAAAFLSHLAFAAENPVESPKKSTEPTPQKEVETAVKETVDDIGAKADATRNFRKQSDFYLGINYAYFDLLLPGKIGATAEYVEDVDHSWALEYLVASIDVPFFIDDLGGFTERRISLLRRYFGGSNSFNFFWSAHYNSMQLELGHKILDAIPESRVASLDLIDIATVGLGAGLGNRWQLGNGVSLGADWVTWSQPMLIVKNENAVLEYMTNEDDKNNVRAAMRWMAYFPRITLAKFQLGYSF